MAIACTEHLTLVVTESGKLFQWGGTDLLYPDWFMLPAALVPEDNWPNSKEKHIEFIEARHDVAFIDQDGFLYLEHYHAPRLHGAKHRFNMVPSRFFCGEKVAVIACGVHHKLVLTSSKKVFELHGDLLDDVRRENDFIKYLREEKRFYKGKATGKFLPVQMHLGPGDCAIGVACGERHSAVWTKNGQLYTYGDGHHGALGHNDTISLNEPAIIAEATLRTNKVVNVVCGNQSTLALNSLGNVWVWGSGKHGRLGLGDSNDRLLPTKLASNAFDNEAVHMGSMGGSHTMFLTAAGVLWGCGYNKYGQLGIGSTTLCLESNVPRRVDPCFFGGESVSAVRTGRDNTVAVTVNGNVYEWSNKMFFGIREKPVSYTNLLAPPEFFEISAIVKFKNLRKMPELNGVKGRIVGQQNSGDRRFVVQTSRGVKLGKSINIAYWFENDALSRPRCIPPSVFGNEPVRTWRTMALAFAMGTHKRLGLEPLTVALLPDVVTMILEAYRSNAFRECA